MGGLPARNQNGALEGSGTDGPGARAQVLWGGPVILLTVGSQLQWAYTRAFPAVLPLSALGTLAAELGTRASADEQITAARKQYARLWDSLQGEASVTGMVVGDFFYYETLVLMGPRRAVQMNTLAPVASVIWEIGMS